MAEESKSLLATGKAKMFFGVTLLVGILVGYFAAGYIPPEGEVAGTIGGVKKAEKYRAEQISDKDVLLQDPEIQKLLQNDKFLALISNQENFVAFRGMFENEQSLAAFRGMFENEQSLAAFRGMFENEQSLAAFRGMFENEQSLAAFRGMFENEQSLAAFRGMFENEQSLAALQAIAAKPD